jgi:Beta-lactamase enzyme family
MNYRDPYGRPRRDGFWDDEHGTPRWAKVIAVLVLACGIGAAVAIFVSRQSDDSKPAAQVVTVKQVVAPKERPEPQHHQPADAKREASPAATSGPGDGASSRGEALFGPGAEASFESMAASLPASVGLAVQPLGGGEIEEFGDLREGHAWSSIKVPILATLMMEQGESLGPEEESWATSAITASDNEAAAALFGKIEERQGGLAGASAAVGEVLHAAGSTATEVATAPPPPGAVSTYGQTEWSVADAARFFAALGRCEVLEPQGTSYVESLMESVIAEQRWGLGEGGFPSDWRVGMKGGWGPEAEAGGGYLVRQSGLIQDENGGVAVAMIAIDESGSYPAGASDLTQMAQWLAAELEGLGPTFHSCTG